MKRPPKWWYFYLICPSNKAGYTFGGWRVFDICTKLNSQTTCNNNSSCFWNGDANSGTCVNIKDKECTDASDRTTCQEIEYCDWFGKIEGSCSTSDTSICHAMKNESHCSLHHGCVWNSDNQQCLTFDETRVNTVR